MGSALIYEQTTPPTKTPAIKTALFHDRPIHSMGIAYSEAEYFLTHWPSGDLNGILDY